MIQPAKKILVASPAWVGDMVMAQSLLMVLRQQQPQATIDVLAPGGIKALLERMPEVNNVHIAPFTHGKLGLQQRYQLGKQLRDYQYDQAIILPNSAKSALTLYWAHIPQRTGWYGEWPRGWLLLNDARKLDKQKLPLMVQRFVALGLPRDAELPELLPRPKLQVSSTTLAASLEKYSLTPPQVPLLVIAPGAEFGPSKRWPPNYYAEVANAKLAQGWQVWMFGSPKDMPIAAEISQRTQGRVQDFVGKTTLAEAVDLMSLATIVVSNDSGLMHIAAALDKPLIAVYGSTSPRFTPPLSDKVAILDLNLACSPCFKRTCPLGHWHCMLQLKPEWVIKNISQFA